MTRSHAEELMEGAELMEAAADRIAALKAALKAARSTSPRHDDALDEDAIILEMCRAHDREDAAQKGEPSPWKDDDGLDDTGWRQERFFAMREAFDVAKDALSARSPQDALVARLNHAELEIGNHGGFDNHARTISEAKTALEAALSSVAGVAEGWVPIELHIVFKDDGGPANLRFVEVETIDGKSVDAGSWIQRDGYHVIALWVHPSDVKRPAGPKPEGDR